MRYATQSSTPGAPGNIKPFRYDGMNGLAALPPHSRQQPRIPISHGTQPLMGNALGLATAAPTLQAAYDQHRMTTIEAPAVDLSRTAAPLPDVQQTLKHLAAAQGSMPMQPVASRTHGTVGGIGNAAWC